MNMMNEAVGVDSGFSGGRRSPQEAMGIEGFIVSGLILLLAAGRLCRRGHERVHAHAHAHYTSPRR
jgi:hypothetical protein